MKKVFLVGFNLLLISGALFFCSLYYNIHDAQAVLPTCSTFNSPKLLAPGELYECSCPASQYCSAKINTGAFTSHPKLKVWLSNLSYCQTYWGGPISFVSPNHSPWDIGVYGTGDGVCEHWVTYTNTSNLEKKIWTEISGASSADLKFYAEETGVTCSSHYVKHCYNGNLYWYTRCDVREDLAQTCTDGCNWVGSNEQCLAPTCSNDCSTSGAKECSGSGYRTCGNYDSDSCLEWSSVTNCASEEKCSSGSCVSTRTEIPYGQSTTGGSDLKPTQSVADTWNFFVNIPSSYSKSTVSLEVSVSECVDAYIKSPCTSPEASTYVNGKCTTAATAGQRLNFDVRADWTYCSWGNPGFFNVKVTEPVALKSNGSACSSASECSGDYCVHSKCRAASTFCGDTYCDTNESSYSCSTDCAPALKANGSSCSALSECAGYCVHSICRAASTYCGDDHCDTGENSSSCSADCPATVTLKPDNSTCESSSECVHYCVHGMCRPTSPFCGDTMCDTGENSSNCSTDCELKTVTLKPNGESCSASSECVGYCVHSVCRPQSYYCGDNQCDNGESCSSCPGDCYDWCGDNVPVKKSNGESCGASSECAGGYCVHGICRSASTYCGDGYCESGESCSSCSGDCGECAKTIKTIKTLTLKVNSVLKIKEDGSATEQINYVYPADIWKQNAKSMPLTAKNLQTMANSVRDQINKTGMQAKTVKVRANSAKRALIVDVAYKKYATRGDDKIWTAPVLGKSVSMEESCSLENVTSKWRAENLALNATCENVMSTASVEFHSKIELSQAVYLPQRLKEPTYSNGDSFLTYAIYPVQVKDGQKCDENDKCKSGNCTNGLCCIKGKTCCANINQCDIDSYCSAKRGYCLPRIPDGQKCAAKVECQSGNCGKGICCPWGQTCCAKEDDCKKTDYCSSEEGWNYACRMKWNIGEKCSESAMCKTGFCDSDSWTCEEKLAIPAVLSAPKIISLKRGETASPLITIQNVSRKEVTPYQIIQVFNSNSDALSADKPAIAVPYPIVLSAGKLLSTKSKNTLDTIEGLVLTGLNKGEGEIKLKTSYSVNNKTTNIEATIPFVVAGEHVDEDADASELFGATMLLEEKRKFGAKQYIFVVPEAGRYMGSDWQKATDDMFMYLANLADGFTGVFTPEILGFVNKVRDLNEAKSGKVITETAFRAVAPPAFMAGYDAAGLFEASARQIRIEKGFLEQYNAKEFIYLPLYDENGKRIGSSKAIVKTYKGKNYAVKIGDL